MGNLQLDVAVSKDGRVVLAQRVDDTARITWIDPWSDWPPAPIAVPEMVAGADARLATGLEKGVSILFAPSNGYSQIKIDGLPGQLGAAANLDLFFPQALVPAQATYGASLVGQVDFRYHFVGLGADGSKLWQVGPIGCGSIANQQRSTHPALWAIDADRFLALFGEDPTNADCSPDTESQSTLLMAVVGPGVPLEPVLVEDVPGAGLSTLTILPVTGSTELRVVYGRFENPIMSKFFHFRVTPEGNILGPPEPLDLGESVSWPPGITKVPGGFVVAFTRLPFENPETGGRLFTYLFDESASLVAQTEVALGAPIPPSGVRAVTSPDGRSVLLIWIQQDLMNDGFGRPRMLRLDCAAE
ncbi:MAG: hypothetical protein JNL21_07270 [Myxococcales bacterium]|nr:hypothetical protein [Myxococcales bacterium]